MAEDTLPIKIVVIPPSSAQVTRALADIEAKVEAAGRKIGQAMKVAPSKDDSQVQAYLARQLKLRKEFGKAWVAGHIENLHRIKSADNTHLQALRMNAAREKKIKVAADKQASMAILRGQQAKAATLANIQKAHIAAHIENIARAKSLELTIEKAHSAAIIENNRRKSIIIVAQEKRTSKARQAASSEGIFKAAGIKGPHQRLREISALKMAQKELNKELGMGTITRLQYNTMLKDTHKRMNLLERGDVRARGALHRLIAASASLTFELTGAVFGLVTLSTAFASPALLGASFLRKIEDTRLGITGILLAMGEISYVGLTFDQAWDAAGEQVKKLADEAIRVAGTMQDLTKSFQAILAPGLAAGMTLTEIRKIAVAGTVAVKTIGLDARQIVQEIRDLVAGGIQAASSTLATSLGLKDSDIKKAKLSAEGIFVFLNRKLDGFHRAAFKRDTTLAGKMEQTWEVFVRGMGEVSEPFFRDMKDFFDEILERIAILHDTGDIEWNPAFIDSVRLTVDVITAFFKVLTKVLLLLWDFKKILFVLIGAQIAVNLWGVMSKAAGVYHGVLKSLLATQIAIQAAQASGGATAMAGPTIAAAEHMKKTKNLQTAIMGSASLASLFNVANLKVLLKSAFQVVKQVVGKFGLVGLALWGAFEIGSLVADAIADLRKVPLTAEQEAEKLKKETIKAQSDRQKFLRETIAEHERFKHELADAGDYERSAEFARSVESLKAKLKDAEQQAYDFADANKSVGDRIVRADAAANAAKKSIDALGGAYSKASTEVEALIKAFREVEDFKTAQAVFRDQLTDDTLKSKDREILKEKIKANEVVLKQLALEIEHIEKLEAAKIRVAVAPKGSTEKEIATGALEQLKQMIPLLAKEKELRESLATYEAEKNQTPTIVNMTNQVKIWLEQNKALQESVKNMTFAKDARGKFNLKLEKATSISEKYIASLRARTKSEKSALEGGKSGIAKRRDDDFKEFGRTVDSILRKYDELREKSKGDPVELAILDARQSAELKNVTNDFVIAADATDELFDAQKVKDWNEAILSSTQKTEAFVKAIDDSIKLRELEFSLLGKSQEQIEVIKTQIALEKQIVRIQKEAAKARVDENLKEGSDVFIESKRREKEAIDAVTAAQERNTESILKDAEERKKWTTGQSEAINKYVQDAGNNAALATEFYGSVFNVLENDMERFFKEGVANFDNFVKAILDGLIKIAIQKAISGVVGGILGGAVLEGSGSGAFAPSSFGNYGDITSPVFDTGPSFLASAQGNVFDPSGVVAFAKGGVVNSPTVFPFAKGAGLMGEAGPEAIMPLSRTTSGDLGVKVEGAGGAVINNISIEVNVDSKGDATTTTDTGGADQKARAFSRSIDEAVKRVILNERRPGGLLN